MKKIEIATKSILMNAILWVAIFYGIIDKDNSMSNGMYNITMFLISIAFITSIFALTEPYAIIIAKLPKLPKLRKLLTISDIFMIFVMVWFGHFYLATFLSLALLFMSIARENAKKFEQLEQS